MTYHKLVRDKIPEVIRRDGGSVSAHKAMDFEYWPKLKEKLLEEVGEFNRDETPEELADILEVLDAIMKYKNFSADQIRRIKEEKAEVRGRFEDRIILDES